MGEHPVARQKQEALQAFLATDPTTVPIPTTEKVIASPAGKGASTLNKSFLAAVVASVARPSKLYVVGEGWEGEHHGGPLLGRLAGRRTSGLVLGTEAMVSEVKHGLQGGGKEFHGGYSVGVYYVGYLLALRHGSPEVRKLAALALAANLAIDYLLTVPGTEEVIEIGGRATGGKNDYAAIIQALWAGEPNVKAPKSDAAIACQMFEALTPEERAMLPAFPGGVEDAVEILEQRGVPKEERIKVVCPARFSWWGFETGGWWAQVDERREWFIDKRTGTHALCGVAHPPPTGYLRLADHARKVPGEWGEHDLWHLTLGAEGLQVHRRPGGEVPLPVPGKPSPPPRPEEPEPPDQEPDLATGVRAVIAWAKDPASAKGRGAKSVLGEVVERLEGLL